MTRCVRLYEQLGYVMIDTSTTIAADVSALLGITTILTGLRHERHPKWKGEVRTCPYALFEYVQRVAGYCQINNITPTSLEHHLMRLSENLPPSPTPDLYTHPIERFTITRDSELLVDDDALCHPPSDEKRNAILNDVTEDISDLLKWMSDCRPESDPVMGSTQPDAHGGYGCEPRLRGCLEQTVAELYRIYDYRTARGVVDDGWFAGVCRDVENMCAPYYRDFNPVGADNHIT